MSMVWKFRILALAVAALLAAISIGNLVAEIHRAVLPTDTGSLAFRLAPLRTDIQAENAQALARHALAGAVNGEIAEESAKRALAMAPHSAGLWAAAAALKARANADDPSTADLLKLSYYTGPHDLAIIPLRLGIATSGNALTDPDLKQLAKGDVSALLSSAMADGRQVLTASYSRASRIGKGFLDEAARAIDPNVADSLRRNVP